MSHTRIHSDGIERCNWVTNDQIYVDYHDREWGTPNRNHQQLFEAICLEGFQAGLSWLTILKRREGFRSAFEGFEVDVVAQFDELKIESLMQNPEIIRNRAKIQSAVKNARVVLDRQIDLVELVWRFAPDPIAKHPETFAWRATSAESDALSRELKKLGFSFVGSTTMYALMQSSGLIQDHAPGCFRNL